MADFCRDCRKASLGFSDKQYDEVGDLMGLCEEGETAEALCEGCGFIVVDHLGNLVRHVGEPLSNGGW